MLKDTDCIFCNIFEQKEHSSLSIKWYDTPVMESSDFIAVPALGQIVPGYLLIAPREHIFSMAQLSNKSREKLYSFVNQVSKLQANIWDRPTIFEHGACHETKKAGACINHAHWHLIPGKWDILPDEIHSEEFISFDEFINQTPRMYPYLLFMNQESNCYIADGTNTPSQFFRRLLAASIGKPDEWDYLVFPFFENIKLTIAKFQNKNTVSRG